MTCDELADVWWDRWPRPDPASNELHRSRVRGFGRDFKHRELGTISREEARAWAIRNPGNLRYVRAMFYDAMNDGLIEVNHFADLRLPRSRGRKDIVPPSVEDVDALVAAAKTATPAEHRFDELILFTAYTGLRRGEVLALDRSDLLGEHRARVEWQRAPNRSKLKPAKTTGKIYLPEPLHELEAQLLQRSGRLWPISVSQHWVLWSRTRKAAALTPWPDFHDLRHFHATWLLDQGAGAEDVAIQMRHNDGGQLVRELYGHPNDDLALDRLERLVQQVEAPAAAGEGMIAA